MSDQEFNQELPEWCKQPWEIIGKHKASVTVTDQTEPSLQSTGDNVPSGKTLPQIEEQLREAFKEGHRCGVDACYNYMEAMYEHGHPISLEEWEEKDWEESEAKKGL